MSKTIKEKLVSDDQELTLDIKWNSEWQEFRVRWKENGKFDEEKSYHTTDRDDAIGTMKAMMKHYNESHPASKKMNVPDCTGCGSKDVELSFAYNDTTTAHFCNRCQKTFFVGAEQKPWETLLKHLQDGLEFADKQRKLFEDNAYTAKTDREITTSHIARRMNYAKIETLENVIEMVLDTFDPDRHERYAHEQMLKDHNV